MNEQFLECIRFIAWLFEEIIRLTKKGTIEELGLLSTTLKTAQDTYNKGRDKLKSKKRKPIL